MSDRRNPESKTAVSRRAFLQEIGGGAVITATAGSVVSAGQRLEGASSGLQTRSRAPAPVKLRVNGRDYLVAVEPRWTLLDTLRDKIRLTGTKKSCDQGECGACTVMLDGKPVYACLTLAVECEGRDIRTIEGIADGSKLHPIQRSFIEHDATQCGFCTPGQVMSAAALVEQHPNPDLDTIKRCMSGNLCRCGTYPKILDAIQNYDRVT
jgi:aerobic-type carbon monoxide dehydrogenase small subunit (CoxS/CutS family)